MVREENSKLVRTGQFCTLFPEGGVVWKIPYYGEGGWIQNGIWGHVKFYSYEKGGGGAEKVLAMLKRGTTSFGAVLMM